MIPVLVVLAEWAALLALCVDLSFDGRLLGAASRVLLVLAAAAAATAAGGRIGTRLGSWRRPAIALGAGAALLGVAGLLADARFRAVTAGWQAGAGGRLERRAHLLEDDFEGFLSILGRPLPGLDSPADGESGRFRTLEEAVGGSPLPHSRLGYSLTGPDGVPVAWAGNAPPLPQGLLPSERTARFAVGGPDGSRLYALVPMPSGELWGVGEFVLKPPGPQRDPVALRLEFLPRWAELGPAQVRTQERRGEDELALFFERRQDRHWGVAGREAIATLAFPLRAPDGAILAIATLRDERADLAVGRERLVLRVAGVLWASIVLLIAGVALLSGAARAGAPRRLLIATTIIWSVRGVLLLLGSAPASTGAAWTRLPLFDVGVYASSVFHGLAGSPFDLLLTACACGAQALALRRAARALTLPISSPGRVAWAAAVAGLLLGGGAAGVHGLHRFVDDLAVNARIDVSRVAPDGLLSPRLALQASLFLLAFSLLALLATLLALLLRLMARGTGRGAAWWRVLSCERFPPLPRGLFAVLALTLLYAPILHHAYDRLRAHFCETDLVPRVLDQAAMRRRLLREGMISARDSEFATLLPGPGVETDTGEGAYGYRLWTATALAGSGLASSLQLFDAEGVRLARFAVDLSPMLDVPFADAAGGAGGAPLERAARPGAMLREPLVFGAEWLRNPEGEPFLLAMSVVDDDSNLPMLGTGGVALAALQPRGLSHTNPELLRDEPSVSAFGARLERLYQSGSEIPPPDAGVVEALSHRRFVWRQESLEDGPARVVYFRNPEVVYALAIAHPGAAGLAASVVRLSLLNLLLAAVAWLARLSVRSVVLRRLPRLPAATYAGRLVTVLILSGLVPLLALAHLVTRFTRDEFTKEVTTAGLGSLQVARRLAEDYLTSAGPGEPPRLDDDVVSWLARLVRQEIDLYRGADLQSSSTRELYASGLRNVRLDGAVYRALYLEREPFALAEERVGGTSYRTLNAPLSIDPDGGRGVISMPLQAHRRAAARRAEEVGDAILLVTCGTVLLLALVGTVAARRVSGPIAELARGARRVAAGDLDVRIAARAGDETGLLIDSFNRMAASLRGQQEALRHRTDYIEAILRRATTGVVSIDAAGTIITINPAAQRLIGAADRGPEVGDGLPEWLARDVELEPLRAALATASAGRAGRVDRETPERPSGPVTETREAEVVLRRRGDERRMRAVFIPFETGGAAPPGRILLLEDVTEIVRSGRLAAWAEMARRVAHEIKNPLTPIQLSVQHLRRVYAAGDARFGAVLAECLDNIQNQVAVLRRIAMEFAAYARLPQMTPAPVGVKALLDAALGPYAAAAPPGLRVLCDVPADLPAIRVDRVVMERALVNLIENALQAMPAGGTLSIAAASVPGSEGRRVRIVVRDTGAGIEPEILPRVFEPYFSTRTGGTGLGLGMVRRAVEEHGGDVTLDSRPGEGTMVTLTLPAAEAPSAAKKP